MNITEIRNELEQRKGKRDQLNTQRIQAKRALADLKVEQTDAEQAQVIIQQVAKATQEEIQYHIEDIVTLALEAVFDDPYKFEIEFTIRRGKPECDLWFSRNGKRCDPLTASGGGAVDVAAFALRVALWSLGQPKTRNLLLLDEPFKHLSVNLQDKAGQMLKELSKQLGLQIIMVSHVPDLIESADRVFEVKIKKGVSQIEVK